MDSADIKLKCTWEHGDEIDIRIMDLQRTFQEKGLSIWGTKECARCGACCNYLERDGKMGGVSCEYLKTEPGKATCELHGENKPDDCAGWTCYGEYDCLTAQQRYPMMRVAVDILGTKEEEDILKLLEN